MASSKQVIVNAYIGGASWYAEGQARLKKSLIDVGYTGDMLFFANETINELYNKNCPYTIKPAAIEEARKLGYTQILWLDCSVWLHQHPQPIFDIIEKKDYYLIDSGYNGAQTISDNALNIVGIDRDEAEKINEVWSCIFGINVSSTWGNYLLYLFLKYSQIGVFNGSREHGNQSNDERFLFHRQDQSGLTLASYFSNCEDLTPNTLHLAYTGVKYKITKDTIFKMQGL